MKFTHIEYADLNSRQQESYNYQKLSSALADYGFVTIRLSDDWMGADLIARHVNGSDYLKIQLKGRLTIDRKYLGKDIWIAFPYKKSWFMVPHDDLVSYLGKATKICQSSSWMDKGGYSLGGIPAGTSDYLEQFKLTPKEAS